MCTSTLLHTPHCFTPHLLHTRTPEHTLQGKLAALLAAGKATCEERLKDGEGPPPGSPEAAGLWGLLGVLRCTELLYTREEQGASLSRIRMLQVWVGKDEVGQVKGNPVTRWV